MIILEILCFKCTECFGEFWFRCDGFKTEWLGWYLVWMCEFWDKNEYVFYCKCAVYKTGGLVQNVVWIYGLCSRYVYEYMVRKGVCAGISVVM